MDQAVHEEDFEIFKLKMSLSYYTIHRYRGKIANNKILETCRPANSQTAPVPMGCKPY